MTTRRSKSQPDETPRVYAEPELVDEVDEDEVDEDGVDEPTPLEDLQNEVVAEDDEPAEREIPDGAIAVPIAGEIVHIMHPLDWPTRANQAIQTGDFESWAEDCLAPGDYDEVWIEVNDGRGPNLRQVTEMMAEFRRLTGQTAGKSRGSSASLRRMRRR